LLEIRQTRTIATRRAHRAARSTLLARAWYGGCSDDCMSALSVVAATSNPHFEAFGGAPAVRRLVDAFYAAMDSRTDARTIRAMHAADLAPTKRVLVTYLCEWLGGPRDYTAQRGAPRLRRVHQPFDVDAAATNAWLACMRQALDETCADAALRAALMAAFSKIAHHVRNTEHAPCNHRSP
jgi:hemoglobin